MTYLFNNEIEYTPRMVDSFTRLRISSPLTLFEHSNQYGTNTFKWDTATSGTGTITNPTTANSQATILSTGGTAAGASAIRQGRTPIHYLAGKSLLFSLSFNFGTGVAGAAKRVGYFDANNGIFLEQNGTAISIVVRSSASGSPVDNAVPQASWNVDPLNGTGPSGITLNPTTAQNIRIDMIGLQAFRIFMYLNNRYWLVHEISNTNTISPATPNPASVNLSIRQEITNVTTAASSATLNVSNCNVTSEGATEASPAFIFSANSGSTTKAITARAPIFSL